MQGERLAEGPGLLHIDKWNSTEGHIFPWMKILMILQQRGRHTQISFSDPDSLKIIEVISGIEEAM